MVKWAKGGTKLNDLESIFITLVFFIIIEYTSKQKNGKIQYFGSNEVEIGRRLVVVKVSVFYVSDKVEIVTW